MGQKFAAEYVNKLYGMVSRNITPPFRFVCFTDDTDGIRPEVECQPLPIIDYTIPVGTSGQWENHAFGASSWVIWRQCLFMDLDLVIVDNIDGFLTIYQNKSSDDSQYYQSTEKLGQTSLFRFRVGVFISITTAVFNQPNGDHWKVPLRTAFCQKMRQMVRFYPKGVKHFPSSMPP